jgi:hypothetical protein
MLDRDDELLDPTGCGRSVRVLSSGFRCLVTGDHDEHVYRGPAQSSRGMGYADDREVEVEIRWRDDRPPATVRDQRRLIAEVGAWGR